MSAGIREDLIIGMAGAGGDGIVSAGESIIAAVAREGYHAIMTKSFGPQIRGGESSCRVRISTRPVLTPGGALDVAVALNWDDFLRFGAELAVSAETVVIYDSASGIAPDRLPLGGILPADVHPVPITALAKEAAGTDKAKNSVVMGLLGRWFGIVPSRLEDGIRRKLQKKGPEVVEANLKAFTAGVTYAETHPLVVSGLLAEPPAATPKMLADGNEMCAAASIFAGVQFFGGYPITPSTEIMQYLTREIWRHGGTVLQCEDEIASLGAVVGASFAGRKAMTATSGPGMSLKTELLGLATIAELPLVCVNVQRGGPSTGIPTKSEQSDLFQAVFSAHGDAVRPVLAPTSVADTFQVTVDAFNIAETYQTPVIILSDQEIAQRKETADPIDTSRVVVVERRRPTAAQLEDYKRFHLTDDGVSPISHPGMPGGNYLASGIEHNEYGAPTASGEIHARMNEKRIHKLAPLATRRDLFLQEGDPEAPLALVSWGSMAGVAREASRVAAKEGLRVKLLVPLLLYPVAEAVYREFFDGVAGGLLVEQSHQGQLYRLLRMYVDLPRGFASHARSGSNPISTRDVVTRLREIAMTVQRRPERALVGQE